MAEEEASCPCYPKNLVQQNNREATNYKPSVKNVGKQNAKSDTSQAGARVKPISKTSLFCPWLKLAIFAIDKKNSVMHRIPVS